ncbi:MAG: acetate kinase [Phycisphaeraceae bacterium]|nr:acetate kinase [Phycisphaeraceae bacterium]
MIILVANLGSTSFKYKLFDMADGREQVLAQGAADRIGLGASAWHVAASDRQRDGTSDLADHAAAIELHLEHLIELAIIDRIEQVEAIGFKAVHGGHLSGAVQIDEQVIEVMEAMSAVAPQHNPPYIAAMRAFKGQLPEVPQVAAFETGYHQSIPLARQLYGVPYEWVEKLGVRRYGFHGASHRYISTCMAQVQPDASCIISCHLGGSCSISALKDGASVGNSFGMTAQSGTFHSSRVGDFDVFILMMLLDAGIDLDTIWQKLGKEGGLLGLSGVSPDMREVEEAADAGNERARLAVDAFVESCRHYIGAYLAVLNGADALVFTGGIGQNGKRIRAAICADLDFAGIRIDPERNASTRGAEPTRIDAGPVPIWVVTTDEELIVARQTYQTLNEN